MNRDSMERLVQMANDISTFFRSEPDHAAAVAGVAGHIRRFWEPRMRRHIYAHLREGGAGLSDLAREAIGQLAEKDPVAAS